MPVLSVCYAMVTDCQIHDKIRISADPSFYPLRYLKGEIRLQRAY
jgi:hypothetical protein